MAHDRPPPAHEKAAPASGAARRLAPIALAVGYLRTHPVRGGIAAATLGVAIIGLGILATLAIRDPGSGATAEQQLAAALEQLDQGDLDEARRLAAELRTQQLDYGQQGGLLLIQGAATFHEAEQLTDPTRRRLLFLVAARYLEEARSHGWPDSRQAQGLVLLGRALHDGGRYSESVPILREALEADPDSAPQTLALLTDTYLHLSPPRLDAALEQNQQLLAIAELSDHDRHAALLLQSRILLDQNQLTEAYQAAGQVPESASQHLSAVVQQGRILVTGWRQAPPVTVENAPTPEALLERLRTEQAAGALPAEDAAQVQLLMAMCYEQVPDLRAAVAQYDRVRRTHFGRPEGQAAAVFQASLLVQADPAQAVALFSRALQQAGPAESYSNTWLTTDQWSANINRAIEDLLAGEHFAEALELARAMPPLLPATASLTEQVRVERAWAKQLTALAESEPQLSPLRQAEARQHWRAAGSAGRQLAEARIATRYYLDDLAQAGGDFLRGQGYEQAAKVYRELVRQDPRQNQQEALVGLGEALLALGQTDESLRFLTRCIDSFPKHPATYRARWLASHALQDQGQLPEAAQLLTDNLYRHSLAPQSSDWRDSLYAYGILKYRQGQEQETKSRQAGVDREEGEARRQALAHLEQAHAAFHEAIRALQEAVQRYPSAPLAAEARYCIAESYRHSAKWPRKRLVNVSIETTRVTLQRQIQEELLAAIAQYKELMTILNQPQTVPATPLQSALLRNCYFGLADALFDVGRFEEAAQAYSAATNRYQHEPEALEAYVQIASCYRRLDRQAEARGTLEQARVVLQRIRPDADFQRTTRYSREDWALLLTWLRTL